MRKHLKKYFIPHKHNKYHPHLFRNASLIAIFSICMFLLGASYANFAFLHKTVLGVQIASNVLLDLANDERSKTGVTLLQKNMLLQEAAMQKIDHMDKNNYFEHFAPDGTTPWSFIQGVGYVYTYAGENLARNYSESKDVNDAWMNSKLHRENLLNTNFKEIGIAVKEVNLNGFKSIYVVQMFGARAKDVIDMITPSNKVAVVDPQKETMKNVAAVLEKKVEAPVFQNTKPKVLLENKNFIAFQDTKQETKSLNSVLGQVTRISFLDSIVFNFSYYVQIFLIVLSVVMLFGLFARVVIEYERQHTKHLIISFAALLFVVAVSAFHLQFLF